MSKPKKTKQFKLAYGAAIRDLDIQASVLTETRTLAGRAFTASTTFAGIVAVGLVFGDVAVSSLSLLGRWGAVQVYVGLLFATLTSIAVWGSIDFQPKRTARFAIATIKCSCRGDNRGLARLYAKLVRELGKQFKVNTATLKKLKRYSVLGLYGLTVELVGALLLVLDIVRSS